MTAERTIQLSPPELAIKLATEEAVLAAGGQTFVAREVGRSQGRISDWCSTTVAEFMPAHIVRKVEALGAGKPGHPHITAALARAAGVTLGGAVVDDGRVEGLEEHLPRLATESADVIRALADQMRQQRPISSTQRGRLLAEVKQLLDAAMALHADLAGEDAPSDLSRDDRQEGALGAS